MDKSSVCMTICLASCNNYDVMWLEHVVWFDLDSSMTGGGENGSDKTLFPLSYFTKLFHSWLACFLLLNLGEHKTDYVFVFCFFIGCLFLLSTVLSTWSGRWACFDLKETKRTLYRLFSVQAFKKGPWFDPNRVESANQTRVCSCVIEGILFNSEESWAHATTVATIWHSFNTNKCSPVSPYQ